MSKAGKNPGEGQQKIFSITNKGEVIRLYDPEPDLVGPSEPDYYPGYKPRSDGAATKPEIEESVITEAEAISNLEGFKKLDIDSRQTTEVSKEDFLRRVELYAFFASNRSLMLTDPKLKEIYLDFESFNKEKRSS